MSLGGPTYGVGHGAEKTSSVPNLAAEWPVFGMTAGLKYFVLSKRAPEVYTKMT